MERAAGLGTRGTGVFESSSLFPGEGDQAELSLLVRLEHGRPLLGNERHWQANRQGLALQAIDAFRSATWPLKVDLLGPFRGVESKDLPPFGIVLAIVTQQILLPFEDPFALPVARVLCFSALVQE